jgi:hypothetical protein
LSFEIFYRRRRKAPASEGLHTVRVKKSLGEIISEIFKPKPKEKAPRWEYVEAK